MIPFLPADKANHALYGAVKTITSKDLHHG